MKSSRLAREFTQAPTKVHNVGRGIMSALLVGCAFGHWFGWLTDATMLNVLACGLAALMVRKWEGD